MCSALAAMGYSITHSGVEYSTVEYRITTQLNIAIPTCQYSIAYRVAHHCPPCSIGLHTVCAVLPPVSYDTADSWV